MPDIDWKSLKVDRPDEREVSCFVSPSAEWYNVDYGQHWEFCKAVLKDLYGQSYGTPIEELRMLNNGGQRVVENELHERGWVWVHADPMVGVVVRGRMNEKQHKVLKEFFGDERLFRGWTIDKLYYEKSRG